MSYECRHWGEPDKYQSFEEVFNQVAERLEIGPRYHIFPAPLSFDEFSKGIVLEMVQVPKVTIDGVVRVVFGFGLREDHCFFVTNTEMNSRTADRAPKDYEYMLAALKTLQPFTDAPGP